MGFQVQDFLAIGSIVPYRFVNESSGETESLPMSHVRNALKRAEGWQGKSVFTGQQETPVFDPSKVVLPHQNLFAVTSIHAAAQKPETDEITVEPLRTARPSSGIIRLLPRWIRRRIRTHTQIARCTGMTRRGLPCRAPAMDNGFCRMHGGERTQPLVERISPRRVSFLARFLPAR